MEGCPASHSREGYRIRGPLNGKDALYHSRTKIKDGRIVESDNIERNCDNVCILAVLQALQDGIASREVISIWQYFREPTVIQDYQSFLQRRLIARNSVEFIIVLNS